MAYDKAQVQALGKELVDLIHGLADGVDTGDIANAM